MKELKDLVEGDEVLVTGMSHRHIAKVDKVTKTQIIVNNARFKRDSGWQCGSDRWNVRRISVPTEKEISDVKEENLRKTLIYAISSFDFKRLSTDELKQRYEDYAWLLFQLEKDTEVFNLTHNTRDWTFEDWREFYLKKAKNNKQ